MKTIIKILVVVTMAGIFMSAYLENYFALSGWVVSYFMTRLNLEQNELY